MSARLNDIHTRVHFGASKQRDRVAAPSSPLRIANSTTRSHYDGADLRAHVRPGALDAFHLPSLHGGRRVYPKRQPHGGMA